MNLRTMSPYLSGELLYGDDFTPEQIADWFADERNGYFGLEPRQKGTYSYHALNWLHGFRYLKKSHLRHVLGVGSAYGEELNPITADEITILEPAHGFQNERFRYVEPSPSGDLPFPDNTFDLITCFGVLHHIPNVSHVLTEMSRCLADDGVLLLREPIVSMGDWSKPRRGLTRRERGIPLELFRQMIRDSRLSVRREALCCFPVTRRFPNAYNSRILVLFDALYSKLPWPYNYHPQHCFDKLTPNAVFYVLTPRCD